MNLTGVFLMLVVLYLSPESVITASGQVQTADTAKNGVKYGDTCIPVDFN